MAYYTVVIEGVEGPHPPGLSRLHFDVSSHYGPDDNNNSNESSLKTLASFDLLEQGIRSIKVAPVVRNGFNVECTKATGANASKSLSVQVIHKRKGTFHDSYDNLALVYIQPHRNIIPERQPRLSTFHTDTGNDRNVHFARVSAISDLIITDHDLQNFSRFTFKFLPATPTPTPQNDLVDFTIPENPEEEANNTDANESESFSLEDATLVYEKDPNDTYEESLAENDAANMNTLDNSATSDWPSVSFKSIFEDAIIITIELHNRVHNIFPPGHSHGAHSNGIHNLPFFYDNPKSKFKDLQEVAKAQAAYQQQAADRHGQNMNPLFKYNAPNRILTLRRFLKAMIVHRLQSLGVQQLDCNEIIESWESKQCTTFWYWQLPTEESWAQSERNAASGEVISPLMSKLNSSLFRFSPSCHITKSIFSKFVSQVDSLKEIINNATCSLIQTSIQLLLPEIKLLWGRQLETNCNPIFIHEWIRLIILASAELNPVAPEEIAVMVNQELKSLKQVAHDLKKSSKKLFHKVDKLSKFTEESFRKTLEQLNPKSLKKMEAFDVALKKKYSPDVIHYDPSQLHRINISPQDLFRDHIFISETNKGELLIKNDIDGFWGKFGDLDFVDRRKIFLAMTEYLQSTLQACFNTSQHLKEIYTAGYPGSIKNLLKDVVQELKFTSKRDDLTLLIKTSIVTHVSCLHEMLTRLLYICQEVGGVTKNFHQCLQGVSFNISKVKKQTSKREKKPVESTNTGASSLRGYQRDLAMGIEHSNAQLVIPFVQGNVDLLFKSQDGPKMR